MLRYKVCNEFYEGKTRADCKRHIQFQTEFRKSAIAPPQVGSDQGHYDGYSSRIMEKQATSFTNVKLGRTARITASFKYHYSSPLWNKQLTVEAKENNLHQNELKMAKPMSAQTGKTVEKIEVLTADYPIGVIDGEVKQL